MKRFLTSSVVGLALLVSSSKAEAIPLLQLDIIGGYYDAATETIVSNGPDFTLVALLTPGNGKKVNLAALLADTYYISAALTPQVHTASDLGSFSWGGIAYNATGDMTYGNPPTEAAQAHDGGDLSPHGIFPTYFSEFAFTFDPNNRTTSYNSESITGQPLVNNPVGGTYYQTFLVNVAALSGNHALHFDLYNTVVRNGGDIDRGDFAPFKHDAQSGTARVPEPGSLAAMSMGLALGAAMLRRRRAA